MWWYMCMYSNRHHNCVCFYPGEIPTIWEQPALRPEYQLAGIVVAFAVAGAVMRTVLC